MMAARLSVCPSGGTALAAAYGNERRRPKPSRGAITAREREGRRRAEGASAARCSGSHSSSCATSRASSSAAAAADSDTLSYNNRTAETTICEGATQHNERAMRWQRMIKDSGVEDVDGRGDARHITSTIYCTMRQGKVWVDGRDWEVIVRDMYSYLKYCTIII